jgi:heavy metal translocating P-type ATPase
MQTTASPETGSVTTTRLQSAIAAGAVVAIAAHLLIRYGLRVESPVAGLRAADLPLIAALVLGGGPLVAGLAAKLLRGEFGSDLLAGVSIVTSVLLGEYLAGAFVVLMLSGGEALEGYAVRRASSALRALAGRMPAVAHRRRDGRMEDVPLAEVAVGDVLTVFPHEVCPVDGTVVEGRGAMDESYLTGEPYRMSKAPGAAVLSGAINGESALTVRADRPPADSRYAKIMRVMRESEQRRPRLRRLGDQLGAVYTPVAVAVAVAAWVASGDPVRFLAVLVVATPCPLLIAIPVAVIGAVSLAARRGIVLKDPAALEKVKTCRTAIFDKTGTLTYGRPALTEVLTAPGLAAGDVLPLVAALERYSRHPLAAAIVEEAERAGPVPEAAEVSEPPGAGLRGVVTGRAVEVTGRKALATRDPATAAGLPPPAAGMECVVLLDGRYAATFRFRDRPRADSASFVRHLGSRHHFDRVMLVSGDRESEVRYLADQVGIDLVYASRTPEQKVEIVREETRRANTVFVGDGINDAPALTVATVGVAFGRNSDVTAEAADAVVLDTALEKVDELFHIGQRMRSIALQSAVGGIALSLAAMVVAALGYLPPVAGAVTQELIDVAAVANALRAAVRPRTLTDY